MILNMNKLVQAKLENSVSNHHSVIRFPIEGKVRVKEAAPFLGIGVSTFWLYVKQGRIQEPMRYGKRVSVWDAQYIRLLAEGGIPEEETLTERSSL